MDQKFKIVNVKVTAHHPKPSAGAPNGRITGNMVVFRAMSDIYIYIESFIQMDKAGTS